MSTIHNSAEHGYSVRADAYSNGRPDYPEDIVDWLRTAVRLSFGATVLDLGAGTGKFSTYLQTTGASVVAVEPVQEMRQRFVTDTPDINVLAGSAEAIPLPDETLDAVVCAQAFHWFANEKALDEIRRVLKPGGKLGLVWNVRNERVDWVAQLTHIFTPYEGDTPRFHTGKWRRLFPATGFGMLSEQRFEHQAVGHPEAVIVDRVMSISFIASLPASEQEAVAAKVRHLIESSPLLANRNRVEFPYETVAFVCQKVS